jgi:hypothetical protein
MAMSRTVRWTVRAVGVAVVVALAALLALRIYGGRRLAAAERAFAAKVGPTAGNPYASPPVPDDANAAIYLRAGAEALLLPREHAKVGDLTLAPAAAWTPEQWEFLRGLLARNRPALELLHRAAGMTESSFGLRDPANEAEELKTRLPLLKLLWAQRVLFLDARVAERDGEPERFLLDAGSMATMAAALDRESPMIAMLIGQAAEKLFLATVSEVAAQSEVPAQTLRKLQGMLLTNDLRAHWRRSLLADAYGIDRRVASGRTEPNGQGGAWTLLKGRALELCCHDIFTAQQRELYADLVGIVDQPLGSGPRWADRGKAKPTSPFGVFEAVMFPALARAGGRVQSTMSLRNLADVALKVRIEGLRTGGYPPTLAAHPEAMRPDPFAAKPLSYTLRPDGSAVIAVPNFVLLWKRVSDAGPGSQPFSWELPVPAKAVAKK